MIAGHTFGIEGRCTCGLRFGDISGAGPEHINKPHWAHSGNLTQHELTEIQAEVRRIWGLIVGVSTGSGPSVGPVTEPDYSAAEAA